MGDITSKLVKLGSLKLVTDRIEEDIEAVDERLTEHCEANTHLTPADREHLNNSITVTYDDEMITFHSNDE